ncbi:E3 ubiquitin-protein ligase RZF1-like [Phoenix dactylifera]|uniref:RING-type E3 ubiquitin transferase n=1 Tax=Phoenix dactylifera TaxID=42345 RepID=A0A8B9AWV8_PHODC|nr:E3 ubiquitin-protein ligase RZF1-like [Phoenix dactylifera]XP_038990097.1 E3 ubiquitin-protein ligase RZF1-like [Phoenix dactylifera]
MSLNPSARRTCRLYWCYQCNRAVRIISSPIADVFCPRCYGRFLHEIDLPRPHLVFDFAPRHQHHHPLCPHRHHPFHPLLDPFTRRRNSELDRRRRLDPEEDDAADNLFGSWVIFQRPTNNDRLPRPAPPPRPPPQPEFSVPPTVSPSDYFTGPNLNDLIDELTQNDRPGPPPALASSIDALPTVFITEAHLTESSQCPVCKEEFELGEEAREMPCNHVYHSDCIVPWLNIHNSCPVCRYRLPGGRNDRGQRGGGEGSSRGRDQDGGPARWNPFALLWPFRDSSAGYRSQGDAGGDPLDSPSAFYSWWRSLFLL